MEYSFVKPAVINILEQAKPSGGWSSHASSKVSRTVTAQVIITLSKCSKRNLGNETINKHIEAGINYLKASISDRNREITSLAFSIIAHLEHHNNFPELHKLDSQFVKTCLDGMIGNEGKESDFYHCSQGQAFSYDRGHSPYFGTYMALEALLLLLPMAHIAPNLIEGYSPNKIRELIDECFSFLKPYYYDKVSKSNKNFNNENTELFSFGILISYHYQKYRQEYHKLKEDPWLLTESIGYFYSNFEEVKKYWSIPISDTPYQDFHLLYISTLFSGLLKYNEKYSDFLPDNGVKLLYSLGEFICTSPVLHKKEGENIISTNVFLNGSETAKPAVWATAHALNAILKMNWGSLKELNVCASNLLSQNKVIEKEVFIEKPIEIVKEVTVPVTIKNIPLKYKIGLPSISIVAFLLIFYGINALANNWQALEEFAAKHAGTYKTVATIVATISGIVLTIMGFIGYSRMIKAYSTKQQNSEQH